MSFAVKPYLRKATSRAKSDVANKLVSMFLHELSRKVCSSIRMSVTDANYAESVEASFGSNCAYCGRLLEVDRASVEHLEGMNRFRLGLHVPGNVVVACKRCNTEKRRDDQIPELTLAEFGWESFLSHDAKRCKRECKTCIYWLHVWTDQPERVVRLKSSRDRIAAFRSQYEVSMRLSRVTGTVLRQTVDSLYRDCQEFATSEIRKTVDEAYLRLRDSNSDLT